MKKILFFTCCMATATMTTAQWHFNYGLELGAGKGIYGGNTELAPYGGLQAKVTYREHWFAGIGLQYRSLGSDHSDQREHYFYRGDPPVSVQQVVKERTRLSFHILSLPLSVGYQRKLGLFTPAVFAGLRPDFLLSGIYEREVVLYIDGQEEGRLDKKLDPMNGSEMGSDRSLVWQRFLGVSLSFRDKLELSCSYNWGRPITVFERSDFPSDILYGAQLNNRQVMLSLKYYFR